MKQQFIFVRNVEHVSEETVVYHVWVGTSQREQKALEKIKAYAAANGCWCELWAEHVDFRLCYYEERVFWSTPIGVRRFKSAHLQATKLAAIIERDYLDIFEGSLNFPRIFFEVMWKCYPGSSCLPKKNFSSPSCLPESRKYLSGKEEIGACQAVRAFVIVSALFFLGMVLEAVERTLLF